MSTKPVRNPVTVACQLHGFDFALQVQAHLLERTEGSGQVEDLRHLGQETHDARLGNWVREIVT